MSPTPPEFVPISPNPFIVGNPVRNPEMFFGRESEFELVQKRFKQAGRGSLMVFCGERRSGKTSILLQIQQGRLGSEFIPVLIDMQAMAVEDETEFLSLIAKEVVEQLAEEGRSLEIPDFARGNPSAVFRSFIESVLEHCPHRKLLLLFDEYELFEDKLDNGVLTKDVLLILANLMENLPMFLIFTGSQHLEERRTEYWGILEKAHEYRRISYLQPADSLRLIQQPVSGRVTYADDTVQSILRLTAGHPFFTQAVCQYLVDALNEDRTNTVTAAILDVVVEMIVEHPFPQMTFLWDTLQREQKLTLALLAESIETASGHASAEHLTITLKNGNYPLRLTRPEISTALETLFKQELLTKSDVRPPEFAFRMDLWRLWIRRMHSVWQVMHEEGLAFRSPPSRRARWVALAAAGVAGLVVGSWALWPRSQPADDGADAAGIDPPALVASRSGFLRLVVEPPEARILLDGQPVAMGRFERAVAANRDVSFVLSAPGFHDSTLVTRVAATDSASVRVALQPQHGALRIEADPATARIWIDGNEIGTGTAEITRLGVPIEHAIEVRQDGFQTLARSVRVLPDTTIAIRVRLEPITLSLNIVTIPDGAEIHVDGQKRGVAPLVIAALAFGSHLFRAEMAGYVMVDTTLVVDHSTKHLRLRLSSVPAGMLLVRGDRPARIYIDERQVGSGELPSSGEQEISAGRHTIEVVFRDGKSDKLAVDIQPGQRLELVWEAQKLRVLREEG